MKSAFAHDHAFLMRGADVLSDKLPYEVWTRYLNHFETLLILARYADGGSPMLPLSSGQGVEFEFLPSVSSVHSLLTRGGRVADRMRAQIDSCDFVIARLPSELGLLACRIAREQNKPYLVEVVGCAWDALWNYGSIKARLYAPILYSRMRYAVARSPYVSYVSQSFLQERYPAAAARRVLAASNVELPCVDLGVLDNRLRRIKGEARRQIVGLIGSLKTQYKGIDIGIEAISKLVSEGIDVELQVVGGGSSAQYEQISDRFGVGSRVKFRGMLDRSGVMSWLDTVDVYIQPSLQEGVPRSLIEAMSRGCPAIGSTCGGIPELLDGESLVPKRDADALARGLKLALRNGDWRSKQAKRNFEYSQSYSKPLLDARRHEFFTSIRSDISEMQKRGYVRG